MPEYNNTINNLNRKLFFKFNKIKIKPLEDEKETTVENYLTHAFQHHYGGNRSIGTKDTGFIDVPDVSAVDDEYTTNRPYHVKPDHNVKTRPQTNSEEDEEREKDLGNHPIEVDIDVGDVSEGGDLNRFDKENIDLREKARKEFLRRQKSAKEKRNVREQGEEGMPDAAPEEPPAEEPDMGVEPDMGGDPGMGDAGMG
jgi:hypothetical protein